MLSIYKFVKIWQLAWPIILANITIPLLGMVDIAVVGHGYNADILSAIAIGSMAFDVLFLAFGFLRMSTTGLTAQQPKDHSVLQRAVCLSILLAMLLILFKSSLFLYLCLYIPSPPSIQNQLSIYFSYRIFSALPTLINFTFIGYLFGQQNTKSTLLFVSTINISAILLDIILVRYFSLGLKGVALANILAQSFGTLLGALIIQYRYKSFTKIQPKIFDISAMMDLFHLNKDIFIRTLCLMFTISFFTKSGSALGVNILAANVILMNLHNFASYCLDGVAIACEALVGEAIGQKNYSKLISTIKQCTIFSFAFAVMLSIIFAFTGGLIIDILTSIDSINYIAHKNLLWLIILPLFANASFLLDGIFIGATWSKPMRNTMLISTFIVFIPCVYILKPYGNNGLWLAFICFIVARGLTLALCLKKQLHTSLSTMQV